MYQLPNDRYNLAISDQQVDAIMDVQLEKMRALAAGEIEPTDNRDKELRYLGLMKKFKLTDEQKDRLLKNVETWSGRRFTELNIKFNKPTKHPLEHFPSEEELLANLDSLYNEVKEQPLK